MRVVSQFSSSFVIIQLSLLFIQLFNMFSLIESFSPDQKAIFNQSQLIFSNAISQYSFKLLSADHQTQTHILISPHHQTFYLTFNKCQNYVQLSIKAQVSGIFPNIINQIENIHNFQLSLYQQQRIIVSKCQYSSESIYQIKPCQLYENITHNIESMMQSIKKYKELLHTQKCEQKKPDKQQSNKKMNRQKNKMKSLLQTIAKYKKVVDAEISQRNCSTFKLSNDRLDSIGINPTLSTTKGSSEKFIPQQCYESIKNMFLEKKTEKKEGKIADKQSSKMAEKQESQSRKLQPKNDEESKIVKFIKLKDLHYDNWSPNKGNFGYLRKLKAKFQIFPQSLYKDTNLLHHTFENVAQQKSSLNEQNTKICEGLLIQKQSNPLIDKKMNSFLIQLTMLLYLRNFYEETIASYYLEEIKTVEQIQRIFLAYYPLELGGAIEDKDFKIKNFLQICKYLCNGLVFLWKNKLLHRDLKPSNIMLDAKYSPKIIDFGSSKHSLMVKTAFNLDYQRNQQLYLVVSTPGYFYSYQNYRTITDDIRITQQEYQTHQNFDVFSLGAIFQHIFTKNSFRLGIGQSISMNLDWLVKKCKQPNPYDRPNAEQISIFIRIICQFWLLQNKA